MSAIHASFSGQASCVRLRCSQRSLVGRKPAEPVLPAPSGPAAVTLGASEQADRPLAVTFNDLGILSFERAAPVGTHRRLHPH